MSDTTPIPHAPDRPRDQQGGEAHIMDALDSIVEPARRPGRDPRATAERIVFVLNEALSRPQREGGN